jgi:hypothetical protein
MGAKLLQFRPDQHKVTAVPKITNDWPFFNLTQKKRDIAAVIKYHDVDDQGRDVTWEVYHNTTKEIGAPGVEAHRVWHLLVLPSIDAARDPVTGHIPEIVPLGRVRECLRRVGWSAGGHQARELITALSQIAFAGCRVDFHLPSGDVDDDGKTRYFVLKGRYSRISVYAIGERHLTEDELANNSFSFDVNDTIYVLLDPIEAKIQETQERRYLDNEYLFSVSPAARRWYELVAPKLFGVIKHKGTYCDVSYSWYIKRHHTLKRHSEHKRVAFQMNRVVQDHLESGYLSKVEYFPVRVAGQERDYVVRYYPGPAATESTKRILANIRPRPEARPALLKKPDLTLPSLEMHDDNQNGFLPEVDQETTESGDSARSLIQALVQEFRVSTEKAEALVRDHIESVKVQLEAWPFRNASPNNLAGWIISAIENQYPLPDTYLARKAKLEANAARQMALAEEARRAAKIERVAQAVRERAERLIESLSSDEYGRYYENIKTKAINNSPSWLKFNPPGSSGFEQTIRAGILSQLEQELYDQLSDSEVDALAREPDLDTGPPTS